MNLHTVLLIPGHGHLSPGVYDQGHVAGRMSELEVIDGYLLPLIDELETEGLRYEVLQTRHRPGLSHAERLEKVLPGMLVVHCLAGWAKKPPSSTRNQTTISYGVETSYNLADEIAEAVGQWGHCFAHGHRTANPRRVDDPLLTVAQTRAIAIEPFLLNGPGSAEYQQRLPELGVVIARAIADHVRGRFYMQRSTMMTVA